MTNDERAEVSKKYWKVADELWKMKMPASVIAKAYGYENTKSFLVKISQIRKKYDMLKPRDANAKTCLIVKPDGLLEND